MIQRNPSYNIEKEKTGIIQNKTKTSLFINAIIKPDIPNIKNIGSSLNNIV